MTLTGQCEQCGKCCYTDIKLVEYDIEGRGAPPMEWVVEQLKVKGYKVKLAKDGVLIAEYNKWCKYLVSGNKCKLHGTGKKPKLCQIYPKDMVQIADSGIDLNKLLPEGCGYKWE